MYNVRELQPAQRTGPSHPDAPTDSEIAEPVGRRVEPAADAHAPDDAPAAIADPSLGRVVGGLPSEAATRWAELVPLAVPCALMLLGAGVGYVFTIDVPVARERLIGLGAASVLALAAIPLLRRLKNVAPVLVGTTVVALLGGVWITAATGPEVFRGTVGAILQAVFRPLFYTVQLTDPIEVANTRFIIGYNGLADLCLVAIFCCSALLLRAGREPASRSVPPARGARVRGAASPPGASEQAPPRSDASPPGERASYPPEVAPHGRSTTAALLAVIVLSTLVLVGTGARGGLTGLAAGICAIGIYLWPKRLALLAVVAAPLALLVAAVGILDKGLEFSSTAGRLTYWGDLARLLVEYPLTGVGLGLNTAFAATVVYQINPDPERIFYAHNTFVQSYLEMGPLGALGMLALPMVAFAAAIAARLRGVRAPQRPLLLAGLGIVFAMEAHGLTDQVVTTNVGTLIVLLGLAAVLAALSPAAANLVARWTRPLWFVVAGLCVLTALALAVLPQARAQALLDVGGMRLNQAVALDRQNAQRSIALGSAESALSAALAQDPGHPAVLRELARVHSAQFDDSAASRELAQLAASPRLDAFDMLQIAQLYRDQGSTDQAYAWAARAYEMWGRPPEQGVMQTYAQATLTDSRAQNLAEQAEAAMRAREFGDARTLFRQALVFEQLGSAYLTDRVGAADRAVAKYGARP